MSSDIATAPFDSAIEPEPRPSIGELLSSVTQDLSALLRQEVELAKAELRQSANRAGKGAGMFAGAGLAGHMVLLFLSIAVWWGLGDAIGHGWSALIVAAVWLISSYLWCWSWARAAASGAHQIRESVVHRRRHGTPVLTQQLT